MVQSLISSTSVRGLFWLASGKACFGGRTTVGMMGLWRAVSSSVGSSRIYTKRGSCDIFNNPLSFRGCVCFTKILVSPSFLPPLLEDPRCQTLTTVANCAAKAYCCIIHDHEQTCCKYWRCLLTQPVALNILRSRGSPESSPSILVSEWQVAMQTTNAEFTKLSSAAFDSGGEKLEQTEKMGEMWWLITTPERSTMLFRCLKGN